MKKCEEETVAGPEPDGLAGLVLDVQPRLLGGIGEAGALLDSIVLFEQSAGEFIGVKRT